MLIKVVNWSSHTILDKGSEPFYLERDNWDDNYFKTRYYLHLSGNLSDDGLPLYIGEVKILRKGQRREDDYQLTPGRLDYLDARFCSIGQSLDYYHRLSRLDKELRNQILSALRDIVLFPELKKKFDTEDGMEVSLYHLLDRDDDLFKLAPAMISGDYSEIDYGDIAFKFKCEGVLNPVSFNFEAPDHKYVDGEERPTRIHALTGKEDSGKDKFLAQLARVAIASNQDRDWLQNDSSLDPFNIAFNRVICLSYSPTITFRVPALYIHEKEQIVRELSDGAGRFVYCGNHDLGKELEESLKSFNIDTDGRVWERNIDESPFLKTNEELAMEFARLIRAIGRDLKKQDILDDVFKFMKLVPDLQFFTKIEFQKLRDDELVDFFEHLAGESQVLLHSVLHLIVSISPRSLLLFNSPEMYLRPTRVGFLMDCVKLLLERQNSIMIVATESPEILRETKSKYVTLFRKDADAFQISTPESEIYGESLEAITALINGSPTNNSKGDSPRNERFENFTLDS